MSFNGSRSSFEVILFDERRQGTWSEGIWITTVGLRARPNTASFKTLPEVEGGFLEEALAAKYTNNGQARGGRNATKLNKISSFLSQVQQVLNPSSVRCFGVDSI